MLWGLMPEIVLVGCDNLKEPPTRPRFTERVVDISEGSRVQHMGPSAQLGSETGSAFAMDVGGCPAGQIGTVCVD